MQPASDDFKAASIDATPVSSGYVFLLAGTAALSGLLFGFDTAVINGVLLYLRRQFSLSDGQTEVAASSLLLGCLIGAAAASIIGDRYGRKRSLLLSGALFTLSSLGAASAGTVIVFSLARFVGGLAIGLASVLTPVYIAEISPAKSRGTLVSLNQLAIVIGILCAYLVNWRLSKLGEESWRWMIAVAALPSLIFFVGLLGIPESPRWLIGVGREQEAESILARIFGLVSAREHVASIHRAATSEQGSWRELFAADMRPRLNVGIALALFQQLTGINAVLYYGSIIVNDHFPSQSARVALAANITVGLVNLIFTLLAMVFLDRWGRRAIMMSASGGMGLALSLLVVGLKLSGAAVILPIAGILFYVAFFALGMGPGPWLVISEIFPTKVRGRAASVATSVLWSGTLFITLTFLSLVKVIGLAGVFAIYGGLSFLCCFYIWKAVPETKGRTLEQIQETWSR